MGDHQKKQPKYTFGLIETPYAGQVPGSSSTSSSNVHPERGSTSRSDVLTGQMRGPSTSTTRQTTESVGSSSVPRRPPSFCTPATGRSSARSRTPGSRYGQYTSSSTGDMSSSNIVAIVEGRGLARGEIGIASIDLKRPVLQLSQFSDSQTNVKVMMKLQILQPLEIIMPNTACENGNMTKLFRLISDQFHNCNLATVQRRYFNETKGLQYIKHLCVPEFNTVEMEVRTKYYCLAAVAALLKYVEFIQNAVYAPASLKIVFKGCEQTTMIDAATSMSLELLQNTRDVKSDHTLFGILNYTRTPMGARLLRCNILQPPNNLETVSMRLDAVAELTDNEELFYSLQAVVGRFLDVDHLLSLCIQIPKQETVKTAESKITNMIHLKHSLQLVEPLQLALKDSHSKLFSAYAMVLEDPRFDMIMEKIHSVINEDTVYQKGLLNMRTQKCFAVKPHINGLLDVARRTYTEIVDDIAEMVEQLRTEYSLPMTSAYNSTRGFHLQIHHNKEQPPDITSLPPCFIKVTRSKNSLTFTNTDLIRMNERVKESLQEIYLMTNIVVTELLSDIRLHLGCLYKLTESISMIDMIVAFAHNCTLFHYVRPEFTDTIAIKQGRHPILEKITVNAITPNNVYASEESNFVVITGPNMTHQCPELPGYIMTNHNIMSGKSTYLRQIALLQIMAQIGSYVPAEYASFRLTDQIFSRIGSDDDIETNASTFVMEMRETNYIVQNATASSLIIIDELGRGTSADEGVGISHAICEYLLHLKAYVFFATHFMQLTNLESLYPNVENYHFDVQEVFGEQGQCSKVTYTHVLSKGKTRQKHYGLQLAEMSTLPAEVLQDARHLAEQISAQRETKAPLSAAAVKERADFRLSKRLLQTALNSRLDDASLRSYLHALKDQYLKELHASVTSAED